MFSGGKIGMQGFWQRDGERNWWQRRERREGLAVELVLMHSNSLSHWFSLFQFARGFYIGFWQEPWEVGREECWCIRKKSVMARVGVEWPGLTAVNGGGKTSCLKSSAHSLALGD